MFEKLRAGGSSNTPSLVNDQTGTNESSLNFNESLSRKLFSHSSLKSVYRLLMTGGFKLYDCQQTVKHFMNSQL